MTAKQQRFVDAYARLRPDKTAAAIEAGYSERTAESKACHLVKNSQVAAAIVEIDRIAANVAGITAARVLEEYRRIAFADVRDVVQIETVKDGDGNLVQRVVATDTDQLTAEQAAAIAEIGQRADGGLTIKMHSKLAALDALAKRVAPVEEPGSSVNVTVTDGKAAVAITHGGFRWSDGTVHDTPPPVDLAVAKVTPPRDAE